MPAEPLAGASHEDDGVVLGRGEELFHADVGLGESLDGGDLVKAVVVIEGVVFFEIFEIGEDGARVADQEGFIGVLAKGAGDGGRGDELVIIREVEWLYWSI